jgi:metallothionein
MSKLNKCAAEDCVCEVEETAAVIAQGDAYCSERCADGRGCDHAGCNCGEFPTAEPPAQRPQHG